MNIVEDLNVGGPAFFRNEIRANGSLHMQSSVINEAQASDVASAATIDLDTAVGNLVDVTGTTTITAITLSQGRERTVRFTGALTLTHGASLVLPGSANITTAAGDFAIFRGYASGVVRCVMYQKLTGQSVIADVSAATQADQETGTSTTTYVSPGRQQYHQSAAKAFVNFNGTGTVAIRRSYNVTSITDNAAGDYTVNFTTAFSDANYTMVGAVGDRTTSDDNRVIHVSSVAAPTTTACRTICTTGTIGGEDNARIMVAFFGDQ